MSDARDVFLIEVMPSIPNLGSSITMPRSGLLTMAGILSQRTDYRLQTIFEPYTRGTDVAAIRAARPKFILLNGLTTTAIENEMLVDELRNSCTHEFFVIVGGEHATMFPEHVRHFADVIVLYEGDETIIPVLEALEEEDVDSRVLALSNIPGICYRDAKDQWKQNLDRRRVNPISYRYDFTNFSGARHVQSRLPLSQLPIQTSRGCTYFCSFCSWTSLFGKAGYFTRPAEDVIFDVEHALKHTDISRFMIVDNLFGADLAYTTDLLTQLGRHFHDYTRKPSFTVLCRADQFVGDGKAFTDEFLKLMRSAGIWNISMGLESVEDDTLEDMRKEADTSVYRGAAKRLAQHGFMMSASFIAGYANDTEQSVRRIANFAKELGCFTIQLYCPAVTPKTKDWKRLLFRKIPGCPERYLNGQTVSTFPKLMLPSVLQKALFDTAREFCAQKEPQKRIVGRIYETTWRAVRPYHACLQQIEAEILLPEGVYREGRGGAFELDEEVLWNLSADRERYGHFMERVGTIFDSIRYPSGYRGRNRGRFQDDHLVGMRVRRPPLDWAQARQLQA